MPQNMYNWDDALFPTLKKYFGYDSFRHSQKQIITSLLNGFDTLAVMPTGGGKSLCYQLPALIAEGTALVISPLIALMKDQVDSLQKINLAATYINSTLTREQIQDRIDQASEGRFKLVYIAPERLESQMFQRLIEKLKVSFLAVDEAHCISEWGHDFRPAYMSITRAIADLENLTVIALTATATPDVQCDIISSLRMESPNIYICGFDRHNLIYLTECTGNKNERIKDLLRKNHRNSTIIYCGTRKNVDKLHEFLNDEKIKAVAYHAGLDYRLRSKAQEAFLSGEAKVIIATNAFGMGIDKPDVRNVIHYNLTQTLEGYYQEAGRAGRDGKPARCTLLYESGDEGLQQYFIDVNYPSLSTIYSAYEGIYNLAGSNDENKQNRDYIILDSNLSSYLNISLPVAKSVIGLFEKNGILRRVVSQQKVRVQILADEQSLKEYLQIAPERSRATLEAILRSVTSEARQKYIELDIDNLCRKYDIESRGIESSLMSLDLSGMIAYRLNGDPGGWQVASGKVAAKDIPIDFEGYLARRQRSIDKAAIVRSYADTCGCKRKVILNYFHEDYNEDNCSGCSSCLGSKPASSKVSTGIFDKIRDFNNDKKKLKPAKPENLTIENKTIHSNRGERYLTKQSGSDSKPDSLKQRKIEKKLLESVEMMKKKMSVYDIVKIHRDSPANIAMQLQTAVESGYGFSVLHLCNHANYEQIRVFIQKNRNAPLKDIRAQLDFEIDFPTLRVIVAVIRKGLDRS